jgi:hypothetical protein
VPALRAHISLVSHGSRVQVSSTTAQKKDRPEGWQYLFGWQDAGWQIIALHGNPDRDAVLLLEQHWGDPMRLSAVVTVKEKDDGTIKFKSVSDDVPGIPDNWDKGLTAWTDAGWELVDITGNREHGAWFRFVKNTADDKAAS